MLPDTNIIRTPSDVARVTCRLGSLHLRRGDLDEAIFRLNEAVLNDPNYARARVHLGMALYRRGAFDEAAAELEVALRLEPELPEAYYTMGLIRKDLHNYAGAEELFSKVIELDPQRAEAYQNRGTCLFHLQRPVEAAADFRRSLELDPGARDCEFNLAAALVHAGDYLGAEQVLRRLAEANPRDAEIEYCLGLVLSRNAAADQTTAIECLERAVELDPKHLAARFRLAVLYARDRYASPEARQKAIRVLEELCGLEELEHEFPEPYRVHFALGTCYDDHEETFAQAIESYQRCIRLQPDFPAAHSNLGVLLRGQGDIRGAMECFRSAILADPEYAPAYHNLCDIYYNESDETVAEDLAKLLGCDEALRNVVALRLAQALVDRAKADAYATVYDRMHEVKNLLGIVGSKLRMAERELPQGVAPTLLQQLQDVRSLGEKAYEEMASFLRFLKPPEMEPSIVNLNELVERTMLHAQSLAPPGVEVELQLSPHVPHIKGDPRRLREMLLNLVSNALQAMPTGGRLALRTQVVSVKEPALGDTVITIEDTGPGIPHQHLRDVLRPGFTTREGGSGFGLTVAHQIALEHRGRLRVDSEPGKGTRVTVCLPHSLELEAKATQMRLRPVIVEELDHMVRAEVSDLEENGSPPIAVRE